jgi:hypothetical protein
LQKRSRDAPLTQDEQVFSQEYPTVFEHMQGGEFNEKAFKKYLKYRSKNPVIYNTEEKSIKDLCYYPLQIFKMANPHCSNHTLTTFSTQLTN